MEAEQIKAKADDAVDMFYSLVDEPFDKNSTKCAILMYEKIVESEEKWNKIVVGKLNHNERRLANHITSISLSILNELKSRL